MTETDRDREKHTERQRQRDRGWGRDRGWDRESSVLYINELSHQAPRAGG